MSKCQHNPQGPPDQGPAPSFLHGLQRPNPSADTIRRPAFLIPLLRDPLSVLPGRRPSRGSLRLNLTLSSAGLPLSLDPSIPSLLFLNAYRFSAPSLPPQGPFQTWSPSAIPQILPSRPPPHDRSAPTSSSPAGGREAHPTPRPRLRLQVPVATSVQEPDPSTVYVSTSSEPTTRAVLAGSAPARARPAPPPPCSGLGRRRRGAGAGSSRRAGSASHRPWPPPPPAPARGAVRPCRPRRLLAPRPTPPRARN